MSHVPHPEQREALLGRLREEIRRLERRPGRRGGVVPCGLPAIDGALPGGGFPRGALSELSGGPASGKTAAALSLLAHLGDGDLFAWIDGRGELYPPAAAARGVELGRLLVVRPPAVPGGAPPWRSGVWAAEAVLGSGAFAAVVVDVPLPRVVPGADAIARRLLAAAERGGAVGLWLSDGRGGLRVPASIRLELPGERGRPAGRCAGTARSLPAASAGGGGRAA